MSGIEDVAREAGVSTATVSRALRGLPRVSEETRRRVLEAAARLQYVASPHAASLAGGRSRAVGIIVPNVSRWFFGSVIHGAEELWREEGYDVLLYNITGDPAVRERLFSTHLQGKRVDAVMVLAMQPTQREMDTLVRAKTPTVAVGADVPGWSSVRVDDVHAAVTATQHLIDLGHRRIAHIGGRPDPEHEGLRFSVPDERRRGFRDTLARAGLEVDPAWEVSSEFSARGGVEATRRLLEAPHRPTAVFAASDEVAIGAAHAVREAGLRVPEDISLVGIDDHELAEYFGLTTVAQPTPELGRRGARLLLDDLAGGPQTVREVIVPTRLVVRRTTAPPR